METDKYSQSKKKGVYRLIGAMAVGFTLRVLSMIDINTDIEIFIPGHFLTRIVERAGRNYLWIPATLRIDSGELVEHGGRDAGLQDYRTLFTSFLKTYFGQE